MGLIRKISDSSHYSVIVVSHVVFIVHACYLSFTSAHNTIVVDRAIYHQINLPRIESSSSILKVQSMRHILPLQRFTSDSNMY